MACRMILNLRMKKANRRSPTNVSATISSGSLSDKLFYWKHLSAQIYIVQPKKN